MTKSKRLSRYDAAINGPNNKTTLSPMRSTKASSVYRETNT